MLEKKTALVILPVEIVHTATFGLQLFDFLQYYGYSTNCLLVLLLVTQVTCVDTRLKLGIIKKVVFYSEYIFIL